MSERIARIPRTNSLGIAGDCRIHTAQRHHTGSLHSHPEHLHSHLEHLQFPFVGFIVLTGLIFPTSAFHPFSSCLLPAVLLPPLVNIKRSQGEAEVPMGHGVCTWPLHTPPRPKSVTARVAAGPSRAKGQPM